MFSWILSLLPLPTVPALPMFPEQPPGAGAREKRWNEPRAGGTAGAAEQMRAFPSGDCLGKFSVTHVLPQALNRRIVLRNHKHAANRPGTATSIPPGCPQHRTLLGAPPGAMWGGKQRLLLKETRARLAAATELW